MTMFDEKKFLEMLKNPSALNSETIISEKAAKGGIKPKEKK
ncbi:MAG: hypothetical protein AB1668_01530 [Nanoarchaeota archaeon]